MFQPSRSLVLLLASTLLLFLRQDTVAAEPFYALVVHGTSSTAATYDKGILVVNFRHNPTAAGKGLDRIGGGNAAWMDRPLNNAEPSSLRQAVTPAVAQQIIDQLHRNGFWKFFCRNTGAGYFEVSRSLSTEIRMTF